MCVWIELIYNWEQNTTRNIEKSVFALRFWNLLDIWSSGKLILIDQKKFCRTLKVTICIGIIFLPWLFGSVRFELHWTCKDWFSEIWTSLDLQRFFQSSLSGKDWNIIKILDLPASTNTPVMTWVPPRSTRHRKSSCSSVLAQVFVSGSKARLAPWPSSVDVCHVWMMLAGTVSVTSMRSLTPEIRGLTLYDNLTSSHFSRSFFCRDLRLSKVSANERRCYICNVFSHWLRPCSVVDRRQA